MAGGFEAVSRANPWLFAGPGIGIKYLSAGTHCVGRLTDGAGQFGEYISAAPKNCFVAGLNAYSVIFSVTIQSTCNLPINVRLG